jgi:hypothetical protein
MTNEEALAAAVRMGRVREIPNLVATMTEHEAAMAALDEQPLIPKEKARRRAEAERTLRERVTHLVEQARANELKRYDEQEGALRREAQALGVDASDSELRRQAAIATRAQVLALQVAHASGADEAIQIFQEAMLSSDPTLVRTVGGSVKQRLQQMAAADSGKTMSSARDSLLRFDGEFARWRREHPSPVEQLQEIDRRRATAAVLFEASANFSLELFGVSPAAKTPTLLPVPVDKD